MAELAALAPLAPAIVLELQALLDGPHAAVHVLTRDTLCGLDLPAAEGLDRTAYRDRVLEPGFLDADAAKALQKEVNARCGELRPAALGLVEAFAIPDALLRAPIAVAEQASGAGTD